MSAMQPAARAYPLLSADACQAVIDAHITRGWLPARIGAPDGAQRVGARVRACRVTRLDDQDLCASVFMLARRIGAREGLGEGLGYSLDDPVQLLCYEVGDHFDWHLDVGASPSVTASRVLSFSIQLSAASDYVGGDLEFEQPMSAAQRSFVRRRGTIVLFPADCPHRVTRLFQGRRFAVVGWLHGPAQ